MKNRMKAKIEGIGTYYLVLDIGYHLDLFKTFYIPSISKNLVSLPKLDICDFDFIFGHDCFILFKNSKLINSGILVYGLYKLKLDDKFIESLHIITLKLSIVCLMKVLLTCGISD